MAPVKFMQFQSHWFKHDDNAGYRIFALDFDGRLWAAYFKTSDAAPFLDKDGWELLANPDEG